MSTTILAPIALRTMWKITALHTGSALDLTFDEKTSNELHISAYLNSGCPARVLISFNETEADDFTLASPISSLEKFCVVFEKVLTWAGQQNGLRDNSILRSLKLFDQAVSDYRYYATQAVDKSRRSQESRRMTNAYAMVLNALEACRNKSNFSIDL